MQCSAQNMTQAQKEGFCWMGQCRRSWGPFLHLKAVVGGVPGPGCMRCMRANFILGNGASWCSGQPSPSNFSLKLKLNAGRILERAAPASIFAFASQPPTPQSPTPPLELQLGSETQNQEANTIMRSYSAVAGEKKIIFFFININISRKIFEKIQPLLLQAQ